jgi:hypothetical protein
MSLFTSNLEREKLREEYIEHLESLDLKKIAYSEGFLFWKKQWTIVDMISEMKNKSEFSNKILNNIQENIICDIR